MIDVYQNSVFTVLIHNGQRHTNSFPSRLSADQISSTSTVVNDRPDVIDVYQNFAETYEFIFIKIFS